MSILNLIYLLMWPKLAFLTYSITELNNQLSILQLSYPRNKVIVFNCLITMITL